MSNKRRIRKRIEKSGIGVFVKADGSTQEFKISDDVIALINKKLEEDIRNIEIHTCQAILNFYRNKGKQAKFEGIFKMLQPQEKQWELAEVTRPLKIKPIHDDFYSEYYYLREVKDFRYPASFYGENYITQRFFAGDIIYTANLIENGFHFKMDFVRKHGRTYIIGESREKIKTDKIDPI